MARFNVKRFSLVITLVLIVSLFLTIISGCAPKPPVAEAPAATKLDELRAMVRGYVDSKRTPGIYFGVAQQGEIVFEEAYGIADIANQKPFTKDTVLLIASLSKPIAATAIMTLVDEGKLSLDDPVSKYLPAFGNCKLAETGEAVPSPTIGQLLSMTSGLASDDEASAAAMKATRSIDITLEEAANIVADIAAKEGLRARPGTRFGYSDAGFLTTGYIAEVVSGKSFDVLVKERVTGPLGMTNTDYTNAPAVLGERLPLLEVIYLQDESTPSGFEEAVRLADVLASMGENKLVPVHGGLTSTPSDYFTFLQMFMNGGTYGSTRIISSNAVEEMHKVRTLNLERAPETHGDYSVGWFVYSLDEQGRAEEMGHLGMMGTWCGIYPQSEITMLFATNQPRRMIVDVYESLRDKAIETFIGEVTTPVHPSTTTVSSDPPVIDEFKVEPAGIEQGGSATLSWTVMGVSGVGTSIVVEPGIGEVLTAYFRGVPRVPGSVTVTPIETTTYTITATNKIGTTTKSVTVTVK